MFYKLEVCSKEYHIWYEERLMKFSNEDYVEEFTYRTRLNYYVLLSIKSTEEEKLESELEEYRRAKKCEESTEECDLEYIMEIENKLSNYKKRRREAEIEVNNIKTEMRDKEWEVSNYYEVTQLINSLVGLLIFPQQRLIELDYDDSMDGVTDLNQREMPILSEIKSNSNDKEMYVNTYKRLDQKITKAGMLAKRNCKKYYSTYKKCNSA
mgnify:CR=1 FL=1